MVNFIRIVVMFSFSAVVHGQEPLPDSSRIEPVVLERPPVYWSLGVSSIVPFNEHGSVTSIDGVIALQTSPISRLGLRVSKSLDDVKAPQGPDTEGPWAAILEFRQRWGLGARVDPIAIVAGGFVVGEREGDDLSNVVMPFAQLGVGLHLRRFTANHRSQFYLEPELGVIPGVIYDQGPLSVVAPYSGIRLGVFVP